MKKTKHICLITLITSVSLLSCKKEEPAPPANQNSAPSTVYISYEGGLSSNTAGLTIYDPDTRQIVDDVYLSTNNEPLGSILQSVTSYNGKLYLCVNNSSKIQVVNESDYKRTATIPCSAPRYMQIVGSKAYVTNYKYPDTYSVDVVDLQSGIKTKSIAINGWLEKMASIGGKTYVTNQTSNYLYVIDEGTDLLTDSIDVGFDFKAIVVDKNGKLWLGSGYHWGIGGKGEVIRLNPLNKEIEFRKEVVNGDLAQMTINQAGDEIYYADNKFENFVPVAGEVYKVRISDTELPALPFYSAAGAQFWAIAFDRSKNELYITDVKDFSARSEVHRVSAAGGLIHKFTAGGSVASGISFK